MNNLMQACTIYAAFKSYFKDLEVGARFSFGLFSGKQAKTD
jgi:hypothetical protein